MSSPSLGRSEIIDFILDLFSRRGAEEYMGEPVSMAQHMEQSAACAVLHGANDELVIAALLHDIGHFVGDFPIDALENGIDNLHEDASTISRTLLPRCCHRTDSPARCRIEIPLRC